MKRYARRIDRIVRDVNGKPICAQYDSPFVIGDRVFVEHAGRGTVIQVGPNYVSTGRLEYQTVTVALDTVIELGGNWRVGTVTEAWIACDSTRF